MSPFARQSLLNIEWRRALFGRNKGLTLYPEIGMIQVDDSQAEQIGQIEQTK